MKKILLSAAALFCLSTAAFSQTKGTTKFAVQVGYNAATVTADAQTNSDFRSGFNAGVSIDHYFSDSWSMKVKALYDQKGWDNGYLMLLGGGPVRTDYRVDYLTIPVLANWHFGNTKNWYLNFGPYAGILLNAKETTYKSDLKDGFNSVDVGLDLGIGVQFPVAPKAKFFIELNGAGGITDLVKDNTGSAIRNQVSSVNVGFSF